MNRVIEFHNATLNGTILTFKRGALVFYDYATGYPGDKSNLESVSFYLEGSPVANEDVNVSQGRVYAKDRTLFMEGLSGEVSVYTTVGTLIYKGYATEIPVPASGVYIVNYGGRSCKVFSL